MKLSALLLSLICLPGFAYAAGAGDFEDISPTLKPAVAERAASAILCAEDAGEEVDKLIVVDMGMKSTDKRMWAYDLSGEKPKLILNALVAHGSGSDRNGDGRADKFSNTPNSHMTSLGLYKIAEAYHGKNGLSRKLDGLFKRFNSNARDRAVVMHPSGYVNPGHVGRSQGCPAVNQKTMDALERAGLNNAVLWIDGPDQALADELAACAAKREEAMRAELVALMDKYVPSHTPNHWAGLEGIAVQNAELPSYQDPFSPVLGWEWNKHGVGQSIPVELDEAPTLDTAFQVVASICRVSTDLNDFVCMNQPVAHDFHRKWLRLDSLPLQRRDEEYSTPGNHLRTTAQAADRSWRS
ncbi:murein L,D-transpeptidase catalytic domain family protein [Novilysobacter arseniciresistens]|uniref:murein L,D-transpeptidase catalytic domain family protein n=1 Tax=Novilysobacter arseniciresistens TaxID=1385522 RepID=UPI0009DCA41A|nr:murein L,D-transpeptidase catalytic domain family protein [Lysobacter arseniciresistens]